MPVVALDHKTLRSGTPPVIAIWNGPRLSRRIEGPAPVSTTLAAGSRIVWLLQPKTEFFKMVSQSFALTPSGPIYYTDLPTESGSRTLGEYQLAW